MKFNKIFIITILIFANIIISACSSNKNICSENKPEGNLGNIINTNKSDINLSLKGNRIYFNSSDNAKNINYQYFEIDKNELAPKNAAEYISTLINASGKIAFDDINNKIIFASIENSKKATKTKLLATRIENNKAVETGDLNEDFAFKNSINPALSPDGKVLVFASPATGGKGGYDLYASKRIDENNWSEPINISDVNSEKDENTPFIDSFGRLVFATKAYSKNDKYDIAIAEPTGFMQWARPKLLPFPINSNFDELYPIIVNNKIYLSSNRAGGCGGFDIYSFDVCGPIIATVKALSEKGKSVTSGEITLKNKSTGATTSAKADKSGLFVFTLEANQTYKISYTNECFKDYVAQQTIKTICNDSATTMYNISIVLPGAETVYSFDNYKTPFFVSGYYYPNTSENLEALRTKFSFNIFGDKESVKYIEKPTLKHEEYALLVDNAMKEAELFLLDKIEFLKSSCAKANQKMAIEINGFADPRPFSNNAKYIDESIDDKEFDFQIEHNEKMTNQLLSHLRAYFTGKLLQKNLENNDDYNSLKDRIIWRIKGKGIDESPSTENELKRRVDIKISIE